MPIEGRPGSLVVSGSGYFLREKDLALAAQRPWLVRCLGEVLTFACGHGGKTLERIAQVAGNLGCPEAPAAESATSPQPLCCAGNWTGLRQAIWAARWKKFRGDC